MSILRPDAMSVNTSYAPGPLASPINVVLPSNGGVNVLAIGGLTKVEQLAGQIFAGYMASFDGNDPSRNAVIESCLTSVDAAEAILAECERRQKAKQ